MTWVGAATADVAGKRLFAIGFSRIGILLQQGFSGDDEAWGAIAALHGVPFAVRLNQVFPLGICRNSLDGFNGLAFAFNRECCAGKDDSAVDDDRAGSADAAVAHLLGAGQAEFELKRALESPMGLDQDFAVFAINLQFGGHRENGARMG